MKVIEKKLIDLKPYENNPRNNAGAVAIVANSIKEFGFKIPIVIDANDVIVCGHTRFLAAKELGLESVPCIIADDLTPEQVKAFRLVDNKSAELSGWNFSLLNEELADICTINMDDFGFEPPKEGGMNNECREIDLNELEDEEFEHECPKCGFKFN